MAKSAASILAFTGIWIGACAFVDFVVPDIANPWKMLIGYTAGMIGWHVSDLIDSNRGTNG